MHRDVVVIGAGLAGLACARALALRGCGVRVFDKGRSPGGRATSRREPGERIFDHGAHYFTARDPWLVDQVARWEVEGAVARWAPRVRRHGEPAADRPREDWWVGRPRMGALAAHLARGLDVHLGRTVTRATFDGRLWQLAIEGDGAMATCDALVVAVPAAQCAAILSEEEAVVAVARSARMDPCWAVVVALEQEIDGDADVLLDPQGPVAWAAREGSKPGREPPAGEVWWTLHASVAWSREHLEASPEEVVAALPRALEARWGRPLGAVIAGRAHRWRYARVEKVAEGGPLGHEAHALVVCGDWTAGARVEGAFTSGIAAADRLLAGR